MRKDRDDLYPSISTKTANERHTVTKRSSFSTPKNDLGQPSSSWSDEASYVSINAPRSIVRVADGWE
jgi:hypothetical protein